MKKASILREIEKRLPEDIIIVDETEFDINDDEYLVILSWIKYFNEHYKIHRKSKGTSVKFPIISKRIRLDFGLYQFPCDQEKDRGKYIIYISPNGRLLNGTIKSKITVKELVNSFHL